MFERVPFRQFLSTFVWRQGEHVLVAGPTGCGKTTLSAKIANRRADVVVLVSKTRDDNLRNQYRGFKRVTEWPPSRSDHKVLLWPKYGKTNAELLDTQKFQFRACMDDVGRTGGWCVIVDESHWCSQFLHLDREIAVLHHQGRSSGVSMMVLTQRAAWIPRIIYSSASHVFMGVPKTADDLKAFASIGGQDRKQMESALGSMSHHDLLYLNPMGDHRPVIINTEK